MLMAIWLSLATRYPSIRGKLFLRNDLFEAGISRSADASKLETRSLDLEWTTQDLYRALLRRLGAEDALREWVIAAMGDGALDHDSTVGWMPRSPLPVEGRISQKGIADALVGEIMGTGVKKGYTYRWIPNHLQDGNARVVPRSLFNLMRFAAAHALKNNTPRGTAEHLLHHTELEVLRSSTLPPAASVSWPRDCSPATSTRYAAAWRRSHIGTPPRPWVVPTGPRAPRRGPHRRVRRHWGS